MVSADRNSYVWAEKKAPDSDQLVWQSEGMGAFQWRRALNCVKWSPDESRFAIGCSERQLSICFMTEKLLDADQRATCAKFNQRWNPKHIRKGMKSTITSVAWHPNSKIVACGSADNIIRIYNAQHKDFDLEENLDKSWGKIKKFQSMVAQIKTSSYITAMKFNLSGSTLAVSGLNASLYLLNQPSQEGELFTCTRYDHTGLSFNDLIFTSDMSFVAAGWDRKLSSFSIYEDAEKKRNIKFEETHNSELKDGYLRSVSARRKLNNLVTRGDVDFSGKDSLAHFCGIRKIVKLVDGGLATGSAEGLICSWKEGRYQMQE